MIIEPDLEAAIMVSGEEVVSMIAAWDECAFMLPFLAQFMSSAFRFIWMAERALDTGQPSLVALAIF